MSGGIFTTPRRNQIFRLPLFTGSVAEEPTSEPDPTPVPDPTPDPTPDPLHLEIKLRIDTNYPDLPLKSDRDGLGGVGSIWPVMNLVPGVKYTFDQSDPSNQTRLYFFDPDTLIQDPKYNNYEGVPGENGKITFVADGSNLSYGIVDHPSMPTNRFAGPPLVSEDKGVLERVVLSSTSDGQFLFPDNFALDRGVTYWFETDQFFALGTLDEISYINDGGVDFSSWSDFELTFPIHPVRMLGSSGDTYIFNYTASHFTPETVFAYNPLGSKPVTGSPVSVSSNYYYWLGLWENPNGQGFGFSEHGRQRGLFEFVSNDLTLVPGFNYIIDHSLSGPTDHQFVLSSSPTELIPVTYFPINESKIFTLTAENDTITVDGEPNKTLTLFRGSTYYFEQAVSGSVFFGNGDQESWSFEHNYFDVNTVDYDVSGSTTIITPNSGTPDTLIYEFSDHSEYGIGSIIVQDAPKNYVTTTGSPGIDGKTQFVFGPEYSYIRIRGQNEGIELQPEVRHLWYMSTIDPSFVGYAGPPLVSVTDNSARFQRAGFEWGSDRWAYNSLDILFLATVYTLTYTVQSMSLNDPDSHPAIRTQITGFDSNGQYLNHTFIDTTEPGTVQLDYTADQNELYVMVSVYIDFGSTYEISNYQITADGDPLHNFKL